MGVPTGQGLRSDQATQPLVTNIGPPRPPPRE